MSLGWQGESAILPSRAKKIEVDNKSMIGLKALVAEQEQRLSRRADSDKPNAHKSYEKGKRFTSFLKSNSGDEKRLKREVSEKDLQQSDYAYSILEAKSKLYEQLQKGAAVGDPRVMEIVKGDSCLVNFSSKCETYNAASSQSSRNQEISDDNFSDVEDEFGRNRRVHRNSEEYSRAVFVRNEKLLKLEAGTLEGESSLYRDVRNRGSWNWGKGDIETKVASAFQEDYRSKTLFSEAIGYEVKYTLYPAFYLSPSTVLEHLKKEINLYLC